MIKTMRLTRERLAGLVVGFLVAAVALTLAATLFVTVQIRSVQNSSQPVLARLNVITQHLERDEKAGAISQKEGAAIVASITQTLNAICESTPGCGK